jgi:glyoxylase-like metal-dependent hydrolase (beta-lactamase superfamily II)
MKIMPLSEGSFTIDQSKVFIPFDPETDKMHQRSRGSLLVEIQPFLVETSRDLILLDAGLGFSSNGVLQLFDRIYSLGYATSDITKVLMSHLHRDHAGGLSFKDSYNGVYHLSFPNAIHYIHKQELNFALYGGNPSYDAAGLYLLEKHDNVVLLDDHGVIDGYITHQLSSGHSLFHQVFFIRDSGVTLLFGGDEAPQLQQMKTRFVAKYDQDGKKAMALRQEWWEQGQKEGWTFAFYHDISTPTFSFQ